MSTEKDKNGTVNSSLVLLSPLIPDFLIWLFYFNFCVYLYLSLAVLWRG